MPFDLTHSALLVLDVQKAFEEPYWGRRNQPECDGNIQRLLAAYAAARRPLVLVRHDSTELESPLRPDAPGNAFKDYVPSAADLLVRKSVNSAFYGAPDLHAWLRGRGLLGLTICGITTNHCCETTARMAGNLGYAVQFVLDATHTFDREGPDGRSLSADALAQATATNLHGEFATVTTTTEHLATFFSARSRQDSDRCPE